MKESLVGSVWIRSEDQTAWCIQKDKSVAHKRKYTLQEINRPDFTFMVYMFTHGVMHQKANRRSCLHVQHKNSVESRISEVLNLYEGSFIDSFKHQIRLFFIWSKIIKQTSKQILIIFLTNTFSLSPYLLKSIQKERSISLLLCSYMNCTFGKEFQKQNKVQDRDFKITQWNIKRTCMITGDNIKFKQLGIQIKEKYEKLDQKK